MEAKNNLSRQKKPVLAILKRFKAESLLPLLFLLLAVAFNFYTLLPEVFAKADPNDNIFQFALVRRMNEVWESIATGRQSPIALLDHWVPDWASGYPLPNYYQHLPQLAIVSIYHLLLEKISLYDVFKIFNFSFWFLFPVSLYFSGRFFGLSVLASSLSAFFASQILTDGLYGADISSLAWRGYGLSNQQTALFFAPLALGKIWQIFSNKDKKRVKIADYFLAIIFLTATFASHMTIGYFVALSSLFIPLCFLEIENLKIKEFIRKIVLIIKNYYFPLFLFLASCFFLLSYWFIPLLTGNIYHNISLWDPPVKWNSYGLGETTKLFLSGQLFDFGRWPILTFLLLCGWLVSLYRFQGLSRFLSLLFPFWYLIFFGRTTWGNLLNLLPMMKEMHHQRLINGLHLISFPLIGIGAEFLFQKLRRPIALLFLILGSLTVYQANYNYLKPNTIWLKQANQEYHNNEADFKKLVARIKELPPGRVFPGRPGNWGKQFKIGATQMYLALSTAGLNLNGFLPESWSLNTDLETFFNEYNLNHYQFYNVRYLVTPLDFKVPEFAKPIETFGPFKLSQIETTGFFDLITSNLLVKSTKENLFNFTHLWFRSDLPAKKEFPTLDLVGQPPDLPYTTKISLAGNNLYEKDGVNYSLYSLAYPLAARPAVLGTIEAENIKNETYQAKIKVDKDCLNCLTVFKMTYHPGWEATIDGKRAEKIMVFPSYMAVRVTPGAHDIYFRYNSSRIKLPLILFGLFVAIIFTRKAQRINNN